MKEATGPRPELDEPSFAGKTVIVCLGNRYLGDDGISMRVAEELNRRSLGPNVVVDSCQTADLSLLWRYRGASKVVLVDAVKSGTPPGTISRYTIKRKDGPLEPPSGQHGLRFQDLFDMAVETGVLACPLSVIGIEPKDCSAGEGISPELARSLPELVDEVVKELDRGN